MPAPAVTNLFSALPGHLAEELFTPLAEGSGVTVERIVSPPGHATPPGEWYDQERDEWVVVLRGEAALEIEGEPALVELRQGDHLLLPARLRHRVAWTAPYGLTVWLAVKYEQGDRRPVSSP